MIEQTNAIILAACGSDERPCQVAARQRWILVWVQPV